MSEREDSVLAEKSAERREPDERERANHESEKRDAETAGEPAHFPDVLLVMEHDDDRAGAEKKKRFKKRVREEMEHRRFAGREAHGHDHVAELREGRVGEDALDVVLLRRDERGHYRGARPDPRDDGEGLR